MRLLPLLLAFAAGCASLGAPPAGFYRVPGTASAVTPLSSREGAQSFRFELADGKVAYTVEASTAGDDVEVRSEVKNTGRGAVGYALRQATVTAGERSLVTVSIQDDPSRPPTAAAMTTAAYRDGQRAIAPGERLVVTRRLRAPEDVEPAAAARMLERLTFDDAVTVAGTAEPLKVKFEKAR